MAKKKPSRRRQFKDGDRVQLTDPTHLFQGDGPCGVVEEYDKELYVRLTHNALCEPTRPFLVGPVTQRELRPCQCD